MHKELSETLKAWSKECQIGQYVIYKKGSSTPLDPDSANRVFWQPMRGTSWCLDGKWNRFKIGFHSYRHSFASNLAAAGVDQRVINEWMGHQTEVMQKRYRHLFPKTRREAISLYLLAAHSQE